MVPWMVPGGAHNKVYLVMRSVTSMLVAGMLSVSSAH